jgi:hypothetical protein
MTVYEVYCGSIGLVHKGTNRKSARGVFKAHIARNRAIQGQTAGEIVTLFIDGDIDQEYIPKLHVKDYDVLDIGKSPAEIHKLFTDKNFIEMRKRIKEYGSKFWKDYCSYLSTFSKKAQIDFLIKVVTIYHRG